MKIEVQLFGFLLKYAPEEREVFQLDLEDGARLKDLVAALDIPANEPRKNIVNGTFATDDQVLKDGDSVSLLTPAEGG